MISRLPNNILHRIASHILISGNDNCGSWFIHIRDLCLKYGLPHPISQLQNPLSKLAAKSLFKSKVIDFYETQLRESSTSLSSLRYFQPNYMSLSKPHPLWTTCSNNSYEVSRAAAQARMLSGRYKTDRLARHFSQNSDGSCLLCNEGADGSIEHLLLQCPSLSHTRQNMSNFLLERDDFSPTTKSLINTVMDGQSVTDKVQLLLDCSCLPDVIANQQSDNRTFSQIFKFSRTLCYAVHAMRMKIIEARKETSTNNL